MPEVVLDGEKVDFQGDQPLTAEAVWQLVENYLGQIGRVIHVFQVDGKEWRISQETTSTVYQQVEVQSLSQEEKLLAALMGIMSQRESLLECWRVFAVQTLSQDRQAMTKSGSAVVQQTRQLVEFMGVASLLGQSLNALWLEETQQATNVLNNFLDEWMSSLESSDPVMLSDLAEERLLPQLELLFALLQDKVKCDLENRIG